MVCAAQRRGFGLGLFDSDVVEGNVDPALPTIDGIPIGLAVPHHEYALHRAQCARPPCTSADATGSLGAAELEDMWVWQPLTDRSSLGGTMFAGHQFC